MNRAAEVMTTDVITISPDATCEEAMRILLQRNISGAPVVDETGQLVGVISEYRLLEVIYNPLVKSDLVKDLMSKDVLAVDHDDTLFHVAGLFIQHRIRRVPVLQEGRLVGVISRPDLIRHAVADLDGIQTASSAAVVEA